MNKNLLAFASLLAAGVPVASAQLIPDGNFDSLIPGTAPDCGVPAGAWQFPQNYIDAGLCEPYPAGFSIVDTSSFDPTRQGRSLHVNIANSASAGGYHLTNILPAHITPALGQTIRSTWEIFVKSDPDHTGSDDPLTVYIGADGGGGGPNVGTDRGPQMAWWGDGRLTVHSSGTVYAPYPLDVWQSVQVDIHLDTHPQTWDFSWAISGQPLQLLAANLTFRSWPSVIPWIERWSVAHVDGDGSFVSNCYIDNVTLGLLGTCPADYDHNGQVEPADVAAFVTAWFASLSGGTLEGDFDGNGAIEPADVAAFVVAWSAALTSGC